ncbi:hypothetical protein [Nostoc phage N1]|nr:hypothetical protein [Nostoc phage N1]
MKDIVWDNETSQLRTLDILEDLVQSGFWFSCCPDVINITSASLSPNILRFSPIIVKKRVTINAVGINIGTIATGGSAKIAMYTNSIDNKPENLINTLGVIDCGISGQSFATMSDTVIETGLYWIAEINDLTFSAFNLSSAPANHLYSHGAATITTTAIVGYSMNLNYTDPLPSTTSSLATSISSPHVFFRKA